MLIDLFSINCESFTCHFFSCLFFISPFFLIIFFGVGFSDYINRFFFIVLIVTYIFLTFNLINVLTFDIKNFKFLDVSLCFFSLPLILTSFGYSLLIPSLKSYLFNNTQFLIFVIIFGSFIPLLVYIFWEYFIYSFLFNISNKLFVQTLFGYGNPAEKLMVLIGNNSIFILYIISFFSLSALISSLIGVALSLYYFFFDALKLSYNSYFNKLFCVFIVFFVPVIFSIFFPHGFMFFLSYAGAVAAILLVIFPIYTLWYGRYIKKFSYKYILFDNKFVLSLLLLFGFLVFFIDLFFIYFV
jgi:tyrosine-specific transport protein